MWEGQKLQNNGKYYVCVFPKLYAEFQTPQCEGTVGGSLKANYKFIFVIMDRSVLFMELLLCTGLFYEWDYSA